MLKILAFDEMSTRIEYPSSKTLNSEMFQNLKLYEYWQDAVSGNVDSKPSPS